MDCPSPKHGSLVSLKDFGVWGWVGWILKTRLLFHRRLMMKKMPRLYPFAVSLAFLIGGFHASDCLAVTSFKFFYPDIDVNNNKITLTCNGVQKDPPAPTDCEFDAQNSLEVALSSWSGQTAVMKNTGNDLVIDGACRASVTLDKNLPDAYQLDPSCRRNVGGVSFFFPGEDAKKRPISLTCNGETFTGGAANCAQDDQGKIVLGLSSWGGATTVFTRIAGAEDTFTGFCGHSWAPDKNLAGAYQLGSSCSPGRVDATGDKLVDEWFADLPWHQKLSTLHSNEIDIPFVLPFAAIPSGLDATNTLDPARYMLRYGIVNVMAMHRTDTLYRPGETPNHPFLDCADGNCVEMKFEIQRFHTQTTDPSGYAADIVTNNSHPIRDTKIPSLGFAITESTIFAPWRSWHTGHYCAVFADNISDSVCYEDYFTTQLQAQTNLVTPVGETPSGDTWLLTRPALFWPQKNGDVQFGQWCQTGNDRCPMFLGKVQFRPDLTAQPGIVGCQPQDCQQQLQQVKDRTAHLDDQFNASLAAFADIGRFPWNEGQVTDPNAAISTNPFIGYYDLTYASTDKSGYDLFHAQNYVLPKKCTMEYFYAARDHGDPAAIQHLKACSTNFEVHTSGFIDQWKWLYGGSLDDTAIAEIDAVFAGGLTANQYGRTMFMYAGLPEQQIPLSFLIPGAATPTPIHDQIYGASLYTQFLPMVNPDDQTQNSKEYTDVFWHAFFMSNHMNQTPDHFIRGIRGRTLWHNEYRSNFLYEASADGKDKDTKFKGQLSHRDFPAGFQRQNHKTPFHGNTCDSCHIRNGSGIPLMPNGQLSQIQVDNHMKAEFQLNPRRLDYTYTNLDFSDLAVDKLPKQVIPSMKLVFIDVRETTLGPLEKCDANDHTVPKDINYPRDRVYRNKIMNFYGNTFHVNLSDGLPSYAMEYIPIAPGGGFKVVDKTIRRPLKANPKQGQYQPKRVRLSNIQTGTQRCTEPLKEKPAGVNPLVWPKTCDEVNGDRVLSAIDKGQIGYMHLLGKRLGNTPLIEMIPNATVTATQLAQKKAPKAGGIGTAGCFGLAPGTRAGDGGATNYRSCASQQLGTDSNDCYLSRFGWIGDRASLEDQVANAAFSEENISTKEGFQQINPNADQGGQLVRYKAPLCGPANLACQNSESNSDLSEQEIRDMATYQRWIGIPQRSEYQVSTPKVQNGEKHFRTLGCANCHVIDKIPFVELDNSLPDEERAALKKLQSSGDPNYPFVSYLGTDLLMHDMGYLSQVAKTPVGALSFRMLNNAINPKYRAYIQMIRTPPLKGLRFNRFVTDSNHNSDLPIDAIKTKNAMAKDIVPGCDFLLHDGRACDAIEATYLHDGPAVKALNMIQRLNELSEEQLMELRAFLYSL